METSSEFPQKIKNKPGMMAHPHSPSYLWGWDRRNDRAQSSRTAWATWWHCVRNNNAKQKKGEREEREREKRKGIEKGKEKEGKGREGRKKGGMEKGEKELSYDPVIPLQDMCAEELVIGS